MAPKQFALGISGKRPGLSLPADAVTRTFGIFGVKDSGKTTTARTLGEGIVKTGGYLVVFDPVGVWWGITRAGEGPGLPGIVIGGEHADVPLEETGGHLVAELCVARHYRVVVVDLKLLRKGAAQRFMADCLETIYHLNRRPLHVMFEEADRALPQTPRGMDPTLGRVIGAAEDIVKLGRSRGLGSTFISQRFATVTKNVVEQVQALVLHAQPGPLDRKAVKAWVEANGDPRATAQVMDSMASLDQGTAWFYSPAWLKALELVRVRRPQTLDSSSTPTDDEREVEESAPRAAVDLEELRERMAETVERAKENDPKELRKRIVELSEALEEAEREQQQIAVAVPDREAMVELSQAVASAEALMEELHGVGKTFEQQASAVAAKIADVAAAIESSREKALAGLNMAAGLPEVVLPEGLVPADGRHVERSVLAPAPRAGTNGDGPSDGALRLAGVLAGVYPLWLSRGQLAIFAKRGAKSSTLTQDIAALRDAGLIEDDRGRFRAAGPEVEGRKTPTLAELRRQLDDVLPDGPRALYRVLLDREELTRHDLFEAAGFSPTSSTPVGHLKLLIDNGIAEKVRGGVALGPLVR
jgi:hypothetical protein